MAWRDWLRAVEIEPSLYAADFSRLGEQVRHLLNAGARVFHFDVGDGHFVEPVTIGPVVLKSIAPVVHAGGGVLDVHLMVTNPERHFPQVAEAGGDSVTFHVEACPEPWSAISLARSLDLAVGVAFNPETPVEDAVGASLGADLVLCMSIHPGYSGQEFMPEALPRLRALRSQLHERVVVQVDGGVTQENVRAVHEAGAEAIVAGTAVFGQEDVSRAYVRLVRDLADGGE
ncbi:MAG TPA: ribulose-phosphate 3-epimerase [Gaiellaceae bacterium]|nr:ribulose-phosphate 3-epimerase [Gaiellaceae bacterium]